MTTHGPSVRDLMKAAASATSPLAAAATPSAPPPPEQEPVPLAMLKELVRQINEVAGISLTADEDGHCLMESTHGLPVMISLHDGGVSLLLTAALGEIPGDAGAACRLLLEANAFGRSTLGGWFGLLPGTVSVVYQHVIQDLSHAPAVVVLPVLRSFVEHGEKVRDMLAAGTLAQLNAPQN